MKGAMEIGEDRRTCILRKCERVQFAKCNLYPKRIQGYKMGTTFCTLFWGYKLLILLNFFFAGTNGV